jgi:hypothetical protein
LSKRFEPDKTDRRAIASDASILFLSGPVGVGKSSLTLMKIIQFAATKMLPVNGIRRCRVLVVRQDVPKLETSTSAVLTEWFRNSAQFYGQYPKKADISVGNKDGTISQIEFVLKGFVDNEQEIYNNFSGLPANVLWINEVQTYSTPAIVEIGYQRMGRYLSIQEGNQGFGLVIADFNPPNEKHWLAQWEKNPPDKVKETLAIEGYDASDSPHQFKVEFIKWPSPVIPVVDEDGNTTGYKVNPDADYFYKQPAGFGYWAKILQANSLNPNYIRTNILGEYGFMGNGTPVYLNVYRPKIHVAEKPLIFNPNKEVLIGFDPSGFRGAAVITQTSSRGINVFAELCDPVESLSAYEILHNLIIPWLRFHKVPNENVLFVIDPANARSTDAKLTPYDECKAAGFDAINAPTQEQDARIEALRYFLMKQDGLIISPVEETLYLREALAAEYYWKKKGANISGTKLAPEKTRPFGDVVDACQYVAVYLRRGANKQERSSLDLGSEYELETLSSTQPMVI